MDDVYVGIVAPYAYVLNLVPGDSGVDLSTVSAAVLVVQKDDGTETTWTCAMTNPSATTLTLTHPYIAGDVNMSGEFVIYANLTIPAGTVRSLPQPLIVRERFEV